MKKFLLLLVFAAIGISVAAQSGPPNTLTAKEKAEGWKLLFDGTTLTNWAPQGKVPWKVVDGVLRPDGADGWLATKDDYANFQLQVDFRTSVPNINSGIYIRRGRETGDSHQIGYELQIRNPSPGDKPFDGKEGNHNSYYTGSFSGHMKSKNEPTVNVGQWYHYDLTAQGDHFVVMFDGKKVLDARHPEFKSGAIGFQRTGANTIEFRNIKIKPL
jgi:3-keto-disaccharide hydrolase